MWRLRGPGVVRVVRGAYVEAAWAEDLRVRCAAVLSVWPSACLSHWTALSLLGLPSPRADDGRIHVTVRAGGSRPRLAGVVAHQAAWLPVLPLAVDGAAPLQLTGAVRSWCDAAAVSSSTVLGRGATRPDLADVVAAGDVLRGRRSSFGRDVGIVLSRRPGGRGTRTVRTALALLDARAESPPESRLRVVLARAGLPPEAVQHVVRRRDGSLVARTDLAWPDRRLAVEFDGDHHRDRAQWRHDLARREALELEGWAVVVVTAAELFADPDAVVARVRRRLITRAAS